LPLLLFVEFKSAFDSRNQDLGDVYDAFIDVASVFVFMVIITVTKMRHNQVTEFLIRLNISLVTLFYVIQVTIN
jgi:hypothetical protein